MDSSKWNAVRAVLPALLLSALLCGCGMFGSYRKQLEQARSQMERGQYEEAVASYTDAVESNSRRAEAYQGRGNAYAALADAAEAYSTEQMTYRRAALLDYRKACELDKSVEARQTLIHYYLRLGDEAMSALQDDAALTHAYSYEIADSYYRSALELDRTNGAAYAKIVGLLLVEGKSDEASELLERAMGVANTPALVRELEALRGQITEQENQILRADALRVLKNMPYYGDPEACKMSAEQAVACARLLSDGIRGKFYGFSAYGKPLYDKPVFWDEPYPVVGYGSYETDRSLVILADLAGDGIPYLCLFSSLIDNNSFEVYGWTDGEMKLAVGEESWNGQQNGALLELPDASVVLSETMTTSNRTHSGQTFRFREGKAIVTESWYEARENGETVIRVTRDGAQITYPQEHWETSQTVGVSADAREWNWTAFADVVAGACPLRDMVSYLNVWASMVSDGAAETVEVPPAHSERHRMATAMLHQLFVLDHLSIDTDTRLCYIRLLDLNGDGTEELFAAFSTPYRSADGTECQFALYEWKDGALVEHPGGNHFQELRIARAKGGAARGILGIQTQGTLTRYAYAFLDSREELQVDSAENKYEVIKNGVPVGIAESEYAVLKGQYETLDRLVDFDQLTEDRNYERVVTSLYNMRA